MSYPRPEIILPYGCQQQLIENGVCIHKLIYPGIPNPGDSGKTLFPRIPIRIRRPLYPGIPNPGDSNKNYYNYNNNNDPLNPGTPEPGIPGFPELRSRGSPNPRNSGAGIPRNSGTPEPGLPKYDKVPFPAHAEKSQSPNFGEPKKAGIRLWPSRKKSENDFGRVEKKSDTETDLFRLPSEKNWKMECLRAFAEALHFPIFFAKSKKQDHCGAKKLVGDSISLGVYSEF